MSVQRTSFHPAPLVIERPSPAARLRRVIGVAAMVLVGVAAISWGVAMAGPSNSALTIRSVEWLRDNGLRSLVTTVENIYYTWQAPAKGGPGLKRLPGQSGHELAAGNATTNRLATAGGVHAAAPYRPPNITPVISPALPGEGVWRSTFPVPRGTPPPVLITSYRPQPAYPQIVVGVAWINHLDTSLMLYPGLQEPSVAMPNRGPEEVPPALRDKLVATFNSAFKLVDSGGGFVYGGHTYAPMRHGFASVVQYTNGQMNVISWPYGPTAPANIRFARQNLPLIVDHGQLNPNLSNGPEWGATLGNTVQVWRSALGIDAHGNLIYAAGNYQTVGSLAAVMRHVGAVRAMQLDINSYWPSFITYAGPGAKDPANLLSSMVRSPYRYLTPDDRDFFAVYLR
ncbi:phosphodiester glycosidase family protein [Conexibacter sp. DBS9H8]|uniref:phosphodiester glycosidase family protein n=1 Tax=Conexibacter sp. DBS9H8 TaxID=2937801 RepID=UPI00200C2DC8|nr:phosphodiester glycosidase family protein [Conexibacter sp. DBS9H8]